MKKSIISIKVQNGNFITLFLEHEQETNILLEVFKALFNIDYLISMEMINDYFEKSDYKYNFLSRGIFEKQEEIPKLDFEHMILFDRNWISYAI